MNKSISLLAAILLCTVFGTKVHAQDTTGSGTTLTHSGSTVEATFTVDRAYGELLLLLDERTPKKLQEITVSALKQSAWETESATIRERQWEHRIECREAMRRSNRDQILSRASQCFRSDLLLDVNFLRKQLQYTDALPMADTDMYTDLHARIVALIDAEMAIVDAIDAKLFSDVLEMEAAKKNLRQTYREPYWMALVRIRADRQLLFAALSASFLDSHATEGRQLEAINCMRNTAISLREAMQSKVRSDLVNGLELANKSFFECRQVLHTFMTQEKEVLSDSTSNDSE